MTVERTGPLRNYPQSPQTEQTAEFYKRLLEVVCNNATVALFIMDESQQCIYMNPAAEALTGYTLAETSGRTLHEVIHHTRPDGRPYPLCECPIDQAFPTNNQEQGEEVFIHKDGHFYPVAYTASPIREGDRVVGTIIEVRNITQEKLAAQAQQQAQQREQALRAENEAAQHQISQILEHMSDAFVALDRDWRITYINAEGERLSRKSRSELLGRPLWDAWHAAQESEVATLYRRAMQEQVPVHFEHRYASLSTPGEDLWLEVDVYPSEAGLGIFYRDITERKQTEDALQYTNRMKDEFLAVLSHELRSPLNPILGWARLLQSRPLDPTTTKQALATIERNARLQSELIEDLLDVSRILRGQLSLQHAPVHLGETVQAAIETVRLAAEAKSIAIQSTLDPALGPVIGDASRLQQICCNLLSNAVKFTPPGGQVRVELTHAGIGPNRSAQMTISDSGKGITPEFLPHVFESFRQENASTTRQSGGLGLGLAIVHHLVELHGGTITVISAGENQGATFTVRLPLALSTTQAVPERPPAPIGNLEGVTILIVDDDADTREFLVFLLGQAGATIQTANSAQAALESLAHTSPHLLLSDIGMPDMDGYQLLRQIRGQSPEQGGQIPAIALTAYAGEIDYRQAMAVGFQKHLPKPVDPEVLIQAIAALTQSNPTS